MEGFTSKHLWEKMKAQGVKISLEELEKYLETLEDLGMLHRKRIKIELRTCSICGIQMWNDGSDPFEFEKKCVIHVIRFHHDQLLKDKGEQMTPEEKEAYDWVYKNYKDEIPI